MRLRSSQPRFLKFAETNSTRQLPINFIIFANPMIRAYSSAARLSVSSSISRFRLTRYSSTVTQSRISVSTLLNRETASSDGPADDLVTINGFVRSIRKQKRVAFAAIGDGTTLEPLQAVLTPDQANGYDSASPEGVSSVNVTLHLDSHQVPQ